MIGAAICSSQNAALVGMPKTAAPMSSCVPQLNNAVYFAYAVFGMCGAIFIACLALGIYFRLTEPSFSKRPLLSKNAEGCVGDSVTSTIS
jgi:hypothetical protein